MEKKRISDYKALARMTMKQHYGTMLLAVLIMIVIQTVITQIFYGLSHTGSYVMLGAYFVLELLVSLIILGPLSIGLSGFFVSCISGEYDLKNIFRPFRTNLTNTVKVYFFMQLKLFLWMFIPWLIGMGIVVAAVCIFSSGFAAARLSEFAYVFTDILFGNTDSLGTRETEIFAAVYLGLLALSFLFMIPGIIKSFEYAMIPYIAAENADISVKEAFRRTKLMMKGNKLRYFGLNFSFIGWLLLGMLIFIFGMVFFMPYLYTATAHFYVDAKSRLEGGGSFSDGYGGNYRDMDKGDTFGL
ncbi:MAG: DUF975 family protein [bacterium]|nr:DUF975 family protein [bacterium]